MPSQSQSHSQLNPEGQKSPDTPLYNQLCEINKQIDRIEQGITTLENLLSPVLIGPPSSENDRAPEPIKEGHSYLYDRLEIMTTNLADLALSLELLVDRVEI